MSGIYKAEKKTIKPFLLQSDLAKACLSKRTVFQNRCQTSFYCLVSIATAASGHESMKLQRGTEESIYAPNCQATCDL